MYIVFLANYGVCSSSCIPSVTMESVTNCAKVAVSVCLDLGRSVEIMCATDTEFDDASPDSRSL